jgi:hypothetical protein
MITSSPAKAGVQLRAQDWAPAFVGVQGRAAP